MFSYFCCVFYSHLISVISDFFFLQQIFENAIPGQQCACKVPEYIFF